MDFSLPDPRELIQVSCNLAQPATREREVRALTDALRGLGLTHGLILADTSAAPIQESGLTIAVRSLAEWLLGPQAPNAACTWQSDGEGLPGLIGSIVPRFASL